MTTPLIDTTPLGIASLILIVLFCIVWVAQMGLRAVGGVRASQWVALANVVAHPFLLLVSALLIARLVMILIQNAP